MFYHNINPIITKIGFLEIRYYSLAYVFGLILFYLILKHLVKKKQIENFNENNLDTIVFYLAIGTIFGARIFYFLFYNFSELINNPLEILMIWHGGMSFFGGLIGICTAGIFLCRKYKINFYEVADILVIPFPIILFVGRIMNFVNGELIGIETNLPFCIKYYGIDGCRHPSQIYEALKNLFIFFFLFNLNKKRRFKPGFLFWLFVFLYGLLRFLVTFFREEVRYYGLSQNQYFCLIIVIIAIIFIWKKRLLKQA